MKKKLVDYEEFTDESEISRIYRKGSELSDYHILHINSAYYGGGIVEILKNIVPILNEIGINVGWRSMVGTPDFFRVARRFHNALLGDEINLTDMKKKVFEDTNRDFAFFTHIHHDLVVVHDVQPLPLIVFYRRQQPWFWRCHVGFSNPDEELWNYLKSYVVPYNLSIYHTREHIKEFPGESRAIKPAIDPLSGKNIEIDDETVKKYLRRANLDSSRSIIAQVSEFDKHADPVGVLEVYEQIKEEMDCQLALIGSVARDDPEGQALYEQIQRKTRGMEDVSVVVDPYDIVINTIQRGADVVLQKSLHEGFGLSVAEALWKKTPVVGSNVGGILDQIEDGKNGFLVDPNDYDEVAKKVMDLLSSETLREEQGERAKGKVKEEFLITRQIEDWIDLWIEKLN